MAQEKKAEAPVLPEVRQCQDPDNWQYGCVAVKSNLPGLAWGVFSPTNGGHWEESDDTVGAWPVVSAPVG